MIRIAAYLPGTLVWLVLICLALGPAGPAWAQDTPPLGPAQQDSPAILVADRVFVTTEKTLIAEGNVEAFQGDVRLRAQKITYNRADGKLTIAGPIRIDEGDRRLVLADAAELDEGLRNGLLTGARMVLDEQLQLAAVQMTRVGGRYTQLDKTAVTSCRICDEKGAPLWQIRARRVIHDQEEKQLYFEGAQFRILDVPVFYFPSLRLPDPTLDRATGFLIPSVRTTSQLGTGIRIPYFIRLGDHADLTLSPYLSARTKTIDYRYRQAFRHGRIRFEGAHTRDDLQPGESRGYLFGAGVFDFPRDYKLSFQLQTASDNAYLVEYGLPDIDRLRSQLTFSRIRRDDYFRADLINFESLRDGEDETLLPTGVLELRYEKRLFPVDLGGEVRLSFEGHAHQRSSNLDILGRDVSHATVEALWLRSWIGRHGVRADAQLGFSADFFDVRQDSTFANHAKRTTPFAALALRYPLKRVSRTGMTDIVEPLFQVGWTQVTGDPVPNDESGFVEFDSGNLLSLSRFPAHDRREDGVTIAYGMSWTRFAPAGWQTALTVGQVWRENTDPAFTGTSGLSGQISDFLVAGQLITQNGLSLTARTIFDEAFSFSKAELRGDWTTDRAKLTGTYLWLQADAAENRPTRVSEVWFDGSYDFARHWTARANWRYDVSDTRATTAGIGLGYTNECVKVDLSLNRRYTSSTSVEPSTNFGFTIALSGFSAGRSQKYRRSCS